MRTAAFFIILFLSFKGIHAFSSKRLPSTKSVKPSSPKKSSRPTKASTKAPPRKVQTKAPKQQRVAAPPVSLAPSSRRIVVIGSDPIFCGGQASMISDAYDLPLFQAFDPKMRTTDKWVVIGGSLNDFTGGNSKFDADIAVLFAAPEDGIAEVDNLDSDVLDVVSASLGSAEIAIVDSSEKDDIFEYVKLSLNDFFEIGDDDDDDNDDDDDDDGINDSGRRIANGAEPERVNKAGPVIQHSISTDIAAAPLSPKKSRQSLVVESFGDIRIASVLRDSLISRGFSKPTPIQQLAWGPLLNGSSAIIQAETGSGKTIAYLAPLLQRFSVEPSCAGKMEPPCSIVIALPTRELAQQTLREVLALLPGADKGSRPVVQLVVPNEQCDPFSPEALSHPGGLVAPIIVGTIKLLASRFSTKPDVPEDKVEAWSGPARGNKYARPSPRSSTRPGSSPTQPIKAPIKVLVLDEVDRQFRLPGRYATLHEKEINLVHPRPAAILLESAARTNPNLQLIACSATVSRMLRREISRLLRPSDMKDALQLIRSDTTGEVPTAVSDGSILKMKVDELRAQLLEQGVKTTTKTKKADLVAALTDSLKSKAGGADRAERSGNDRPIVTPRTISHAYVPCREGDLPTKVEALLIALTLHRPSAPLVFIPDGVGIDGVVGSLKSSGFDAMPLHVASANPATIESYSRSLASRGDPSKPGQGEPLPILVASESSARGLHFDGVDAVFILSRPESADEYLHLAGRTGRCGLQGQVISVVTYREAAALKVWASHLGFGLEKLDGISD